MKRLFLLGLFLLGLALPIRAQLTFTSIDFPGGTLTTTRGINNKGDIVGSYRIRPRGQCGHGSASHLHRDALRRHFPEHRYAVFASPPRRALRRPRPGLNRVHSRECG